MTKYFYPDFTPVDVLDKRVARELKSLQENDEVKEIALRVAEHRADDCCHWACLVLDDKTDRSVAKAMREMVQRLPLHRAEGFKKEEIDIDDYNFSYIDISVVKR